MASKITLYSHQEATVQRMMAEPTKSILLASEQDQGKTVISIEFALRMGFKRVLFIGIKDTWEQFKNRSEAQSDGKVTIRNIDAKAAGKRAEADLLWGVEGWYFIGQQLFNRRDWANKKRLEYWDSLELDLIVYDEVHMAAGYNTNGQRTIHAVHPTWKIAMSGTFYANKFTNSWAPTRWLWPDLIPRSYYVWAEKWVHSEPILKRNGTPMLTPRGEQLKAGNLPVPERERLSRDIGELPPEGRFVASLPCYIRATGDEVPAPEVIEVDILPEQRKMYDRLESDLLVWVKSRPFIVEWPVTLKSRLRSATLGTFDFEIVDKKVKGEIRQVQEIFYADDMQSTKLDALFGKLAEFPDEKVVLGTHSKKFAKIVVKRMQERGLRAVEWSGDVDAKGRQSIKDAWLADEIQYIVSVMKSFSTGLDWAQHNCWRMGVLSEPDGDPTTLVQWVRRVFRTGPHKHKFEWFTILARDTKDFGVYSNLELQQIAQQNSLRLA